MTRRIHCPISVLAAIAASFTCRAAPPADATVFEGKVLPILEEHCFDCHGEDTQKHKLRLDTVAGNLRGGESGEPLLVRGVSAESYIINRVTSANAKEVMPPKGERLTAEQVGV